MQSCLQAEMVNRIAPSRRKPLVRISLIPGLPSVRGSKDEVRSLCALTRDISSPEYPWLQILENLNLPPVAAILVGRAGAP